MGLVDTLAFLWPAFAAGLILAGIHAYLGLHVLSRGVIFVDLALAQTAALGAAVATLAGHPAQGSSAYFYSLVFALGGAALLALTRTRHERVPQEALIGVVYVVAAAAVVLVLDRSPEGAERVKGLLVGNIAAVGPAEVRSLAILYGLVGLGHWCFRRRFLDLSLGRMPPGPAAFAWDFAFYASFAVVVTSSVRVAGVLLVFAYLVVPAAVGALVADRIGRRLTVGWSVGTAGTFAGLGSSVVWNLPAGAAVVVVSGLVLAGAMAARAALGQPGSRRRSLVRAGLAAGAAAGSALTVAALLLVAFPRWNHFWLTAIERRLPVVETVFLSPAELEMRGYTSRAIARAEAEVVRLQRLQEAVRLGDRQFTEEQAFTVRQYLLGRQEILAGDRWVMSKLRERARVRQRFVLGLPLAGLGALAAWSAISRLRGMREAPRARHGRGAQPVEPAPASAARPSAAETPS